MNRMKKVKALIGCLAVVIGFMLTTCLASAQTPATTPPPRPLPPVRPASSISADKGSPSDSGPPLTSFEEEMHAKRLIRLAEKEHKENLARAKEISDLAKQLLSVKDKSTLDREDLKRVERLEKLTKKIRGEAGGEHDDVQISNRPADLTSAVTQIAEVTESLSKTVQNTPRQVVSASVIDGANVLLELIRILRTFSAKF